MTKVYIGLPFLGFGVGMAVTVGDQLGETALVVAAGVLTGCLTGMLFGIIAYAAGVKDGRARAMAMQPPPEPPMMQQPNMIVIDPSQFAPRQPPRGGLTNSGSIRAMPQDMY